MGAQRGQRRQNLERAQPDRESLDLLLDDPLGPPRLGLTDLAIAVGHRLEIIDVVQRDALQAPAGGIDIPGHREIDQQQRALLPGAHDVGDLPHLQEKMGRCGGGDDDVGLQERLGQLVEGHAGAVVATGEAERPVPAAVGHEHRGGTAVGQRASGQLGGLAGADDDHAATLERPEPFLGQGHGGPRQAQLPFADRRLGPHPLAGLQRRLEEPVGQRPGRLVGQRRIVGALDLTLDLGLADEHRIQPRDNAV